MTSAQALSTTEPSIVEGLEGASVWSPAPRALERPDTLSPIAEEPSSFFLTDSVDAHSACSDDEAPQSHPPNERRIWPQALALSLTSAATQFLVLQAPKVSSRLERPFEAVCCWGLAASLVVGDRIQDPERARNSPQPAWQWLRHVASLALWTLPLLVRSNAPLAGSAIGLGAALGVGAAVALGLCAGRAFCAPSAPEAPATGPVAPRLDDMARLIGSTALIMPIGAANNGGRTLVALGATLAGIYIGLRDAGRPQARAPVIPHPAAEEPNAWRQARAMAITASELAVRVALALRLIGTLN